MFLFFELTRDVGVMVDANEASDGLFASLCSSDNKALFV